jgi:hypothetical protein
MRILLFLWGFFLLPTPASAGGEVILMVNMNYSSKELATLKEVAARRGQQVVMVPPENAIPEVEDLFGQRDNLEKQIKARRPDLNKAQIRTIVGEYMRKGLASEKSPDLNNILANEIESLHRAAQSVSQKEKRLGSVEEQLQAKIRELRAKGQRVDTLVFSAHSDGSNLSGETSNRLSSSAITRIERENPDFFKQPRHVLLLGCYNMTETNHFRWRHELFTNATLIAGFGVRAPSRNNPASSNYIRDVLGAADSLDRKLANSGPLDAKFVESVFKKLSAVTNTQSVIDYCLQIIEGQPGARELSCDEQWKIFKAQADMFHADYLDLRNLTKDPPQEEEDNELRSFYNTLQNTCPAKNAKNIPDNQKKKAERYRTSVRESIIRLIYWWNVQKNFAVYYDDEILDFHKGLKYFGIKGKMPPLDGSTGRVEFVKAYNAIDRAIQDKRWEIEDARSALGDSSSGNYQKRRELDRKERDLQRLENLFKVYYPLYALEGEDTVGDSEKSGPESTLTRGGIPFHWIEPGAVLHSRSEQ